MLMQISRFVPAPIRSVLGDFRLRLHRREFARSYYTPKLSQIERWLSSSREVTNFTYDITDESRQYLAAFVAAVTGIASSLAAAYIAEIDDDEALRQHIRDETVKAGSRVADTVQHYGRRLGWYAFVRATKPALVVETGVEKGLGSCVLAAAILRNRADGYPGKYLGTDIDPAAGYLFTGRYAEAGHILYGDSIASLQSLDGPIDLFINDSDHSARYEAEEYKTIERLLSPRALVLADNAHATSALCDFAMNTDRNFLFWREVPNDHWYPGGGIGVAYSSKPLQDK